MLQLYQPYLKHYRNPLHRRANAALLLFHISFPCHASMPVTLLCISLCSACYVLPHGCTVSLYAVHQLSSLNMQCLLCDDGPDDVLHLLHTTILRPC